MRALSEVLGAAKARRRARPMRELPLRLQTAHLSVYEVVAGAKRAHDAMQMAEGTDEMPRRLLAWERDHTPSDEDAAPYLKIVQRLAGKAFGTATCSRRARLTFGSSGAKPGSPYAQGDDDKPADPTWLSFVLLGHLSGMGRKVRPQLPGGKLASRGAWRRAMAEVCRKPPEAYAKLGGAVMTALSTMTQQPHDPRVETNYCADPGWGDAVTGFANVRHKLHAAGRCPCGTR